MNARNAPRAAVPEVYARASTAVSLGPIHGLQPSPNSTPSSGALAIPARGRKDGFTIRPANANRSSAPANNRPSAIVSAPSTTVRPCWCDLSAVPTLPNASPYDVYRAENPSTNSAVPATTRLRGGGASAPASATPAPPGGEPAVWALAGSAPDRAPTGRALGVATVRRPPSDPPPAPDMPVT